MRHFDIWRDRATSFASMAAMDWRTSTLTGAGDAAQVVILRASGTLFDVLQIPTMLGRGLTRDDENRERPPVAVISEQLWRERLGGDPGIVGRLVTLNGAPFTIVGVIPRGYALPRLQPLAESGTVTTEFAAIVPFRISLANFDWMGQFNYGVVARLKPGVTLQQSRAEMNVLQGTVAEIARRQTRAPAELRGWIMPLEETIVGPVRRGLLLLLGAMGALLLIACANLANLTLTRTIGRLRESAVRAALGASRSRLVRGVMVDQVVLAAIGGAAGVALAAAALRIFVTTAPISLPRVHEVAIDARVVGFARGSFAFRCAHRCVVAGVARWTRQPGVRAAQRRPRERPRRTPRTEHAPDCAGGAVGDAARGQRAVRVKPDPCAARGHRLCGRRCGDGRSGAGVVEVSEHPRTRRVVRPRPRSRARVARRDGGNVDVRAPADRRNLCGQDHPPGSPRRVFDRQLPLRRTRLFPRDRDADRPGQEHRGTRPDRTRSRRR